MTTSAASTSAVDFLIVTALPEERDALLALLEPVQKIWREGSPTYYRAKISAYAQGGEYHVAITMLNDMGNVEAAQHTTQAIHDLGPDYVLMVGIAGGVRGKVQLGDVIVARQIIYYEHAKLTPAGLDARPSAYPADSTLLDRAQNYTDLSWRDLIRTARPAKRGRKTPQQQQSDTIFGVVATGEKVIADAAIITQLQQMHSKLIGVEMEAFGVAVAAANNRDRPRFMAIRGICDYADNKKDDRWHRYAAESAAAFTIGFLRSGPVVPRKIRVERQVRDATLIAIRHQSMERFPDRAIISSLPPELADYSIEEILVDQSDLFSGGRLTDPLQAVRRQGNLAQRLDELLNKQGDAKVAYYGIAHIPLLFHAGYSLSNKRAIHLFDFNRLARVWNMLQLGGDISTLRLSGLPVRVKRTKGDVVIRVSISYEVTVEAIADVVSSPIASLHLSIEQPRLDVVTSEHQVQKYGQVFRSMLDGIHHKLPNATCLHLFYSGPPPVAFHFGQQISKTIHPRVIVYNYFAQDDPQYSWGLEITAPLDAPQLVIHPTRQEIKSPM